jgi:septal ring factor EnvC (AmiA/AmiB activator)
MHSYLRRAIVVSSIVALIAFLSVTTIAWLRRPRAPVTRAAERAPAPLSFNDEDGSVYDLRLRMDELRSGLEQRLLESEQRRQQLQKQVEALLIEQEAMAKQMGEMDRELSRIRRRVAEQAPPQKAPAQKTPSTTSPLPAGGTAAPNAAPEIAPPAGTSGTTVP